MAEPADDEATGASEAYLTVGTGKVCGGGSGNDCKSHLFCEYPEGSCGLDAQAGICRSTSVACTNKNEPVCGCDGVNYQNECKAQKAGTSVASSGACPIEYSASIAGGQLTLYANDSIVWSVPVSGQRCTVYPDASYCGSFVPTVIGADDGGNVFLANAVYGGSAYVTASFTIGSSAQQTVSAEGPQWNGAFYRVAAGALNGVNTSSANLFANGYPPASAYTYDGLGHLWVYQGQTWGKQVF